MMNKKLLFGILVVVILIIGGYSLFISKYPLNISGDPFGAPPKGTAPNSLSVSEYPLDISGDPFGAPPKKGGYNCGPEDRYKFNVTINSKDDFVNFIKNNEIDYWVRLDNFKGTLNGKVNWNNVLKTTKIEKIDSRTIYVLDYNPQYCSGYTLKMTNDGHVSVYGCCGK